MIESERLRLIPFTKDHFEAILANENEKLTSLLKVQPIETWTEFGEAQKAIHSLYSIYESLEGDRRWGSYFIVYEKDNCLVGTCGFKGKPNEERCVEIGYEINSTYQGKGFATETIKALVHFAFSQQVNIILAHTLSEDEPSTNVLRKCNFKYVREINDPEDGLIWEWSLTDRIEIENTRPKFQSRQEIIIASSIDRVWNFNQDLSLISSYHPRVTRVDLVSGVQFREAGVSYRCHLTDGKNTCMERDIEIVPYHKIVTIMPEDTMGLSKLLRDYLVETIFTRIDDAHTKIEFNHYYSTKTLKTKVISLIAKRKIGKESMETLKAMKKAIEEINE